MICDVERFQTNCISAEGSVYKYSAVLIAIRFTFYSSTILQLQIEYIMACFVYFMTYFVFLSLTTVSRLQE